jgi:hypothetical protein
MLPRAGQPGARSRPLAAVEDAHAGGLTGQSVPGRGHAFVDLARDANTEPPCSATIPPRPVTPDPAAPDAFPAPPYPEREVVTLSAPAESRLAAIKGSRVPPGIPAPPIRRGSLFLIPFSLWCRCAVVHVLAGTVCPGCQFPAGAKGSRAPRRPLPDRRPERSWKFRVPRKNRGTVIHRIFRETHIFHDLFEIKSQHRPARITRHHRTRPPGCAWPGHGRSDPDRRLWSQTLPGEFGGDLPGRQADGQEAAQVRPGLLPGRTVGYRSATVSACQVPVPMVAQ